VTPDARGPVRARRLLGVLAVLATSALVVAGCNGDGDGRVAANSAASTTASLAGGVTTTGGPTTTPGGPCLPGATTDAKQQVARPAPPVALLTDVRTGGHGCYDRVTFELKGAMPGYTVEYRNGPFFRGESTQATAVPGSAFLVVRLSPAAGVDLSQPSAPATYTGPRSIVPAGAGPMRSVVNIEDFEANLVWVIGLDTVRPFTVGTLSGPTRVFVDVAT
jgi:hypothetical protein